MSNLAVNACVSVEHNVCRM